MNYREGTCKQLGGGDDAPDSTPQAYIGKRWRLGGGMGARVQAPHQCSGAIFGNPNVDACSSKREIFYMHR
jgi:hypothetical protein